MHLERVLVVNRTRFLPDEWGSPGFELRHLNEPLEYLGMVDNIDNFYFGDYTDSNEALINYCVQKKPQALLISIQFLRGDNAPPGPEAISHITHELGIPTVMFWWDIHQGFIAGILERYAPAITLNVIGGADASSHRELALQGTKYVYAGAVFDERLFDRPEGVRDIPVGFHGSLNRNRPQWIAGLSKLHIPVHVAGGLFIDGRKNLSTKWLTRQEFNDLLFRTKIELNFSSEVSPVHEPVLSPNLERLKKRLRRPVTVLKKGREALTYVVSHRQQPLSSLKHVVSVAPVHARELNAKKPGPVSKKPIYMLRARIWETMWCRTFLLEEDNEVTSKYFEPYVDYVPFTTLKDLAEKVRYYLEHDEERDLIRRQGRATVEKYHNARIYWENIFEIIGLKPGGSFIHRPGEIWNKQHFDNWYLSDDAGNTKGS
jgi:hypothetical protein